MDKPIAFKSLTNTMALYITNINAADNTVTTVFSDGKCKTTASLQFTRKGHCYFRKQHVVHYLNEFMRCS